jgi:formylglycine-generating enzyme required for sulfatase activity
MKNRLAARLNFVVAWAMLIFLAPQGVVASGIQVLNTTVTTNTDKKTAQVKFTVTWDHSWRISSEATGPKNWDAAWVFIKFREVPNEDWSHGYLATGTGLKHKVPDNAEYKVGTSPANIGGVDKTPGVGAFIYRKVDGNGTFTAQDVELEWDYEANGLTGGEQVEVCVLATEMVYVPEGPFYIGDRSSTGRFINYTASAPYLIGSEAMPSYMRSYFDGNNRGWTGAGPGVSDDFDYSTGRNVDGNYPKGFKGFYCMKHEITQGEYTLFLNKVSVAVKNAGTYFPNKTDARHGIVKNGGTGTTPASYDLKNPGDAFRACNFLSAKDVLAYLDWAGLRPMTELEYEKSCRGLLAVPSAPNNDQYAWGSISINNAAGLSNEGQNNEAPSNVEANCVVGKAGAGGTASAVLAGPIRSGGFATPVSSRTKAGATYWGIMEMSGNLWERCVGVGNATGRAYTGVHGNGEIGPGSNPDLPAAWPNINGTGLGFRGGSYKDLPDRARISDRTSANSVDASRQDSYGGRGVRTVP